MNASVWDGLACVICGRDFEVGVRSVPMGRAYGSQVFACAGGCVADGVSTRTGTGGYVTNHANG